MKAALQSSIQAAASNARTAGCRGIGTTYALPSVLDCSDNFATARPSMPPPLPPANNSIGRGGT